MSEAPSSIERCIPIALLALAVLTQGSCALHFAELSGANPTQSSLEVGTQAECVPDFSDRNGWLGGDAAYSVPLPNARSRTSLWLFGDSFVARPGSPVKRSYPFVHNSIALSHCSTQGEWTVASFWRTSDASGPGAFFEPDPEADWVRTALRESGEPPYYWPFDGFDAHGALFVGLLRVVHSQPRGLFRLPFRLVGMDLARIDNPDDPPPEWRMRLSTLSENSIAFPGSAFVLDGGSLYAFTFFDGDDGRSPRALARLDLSLLRTWRADLRGTFETLSETGRWEPGFVPERAKILMDDDATEMSVHFDATLGRWLAVYTTPLPPTSPDPRRRSGEIVLRTARDLAGPWSEPRALFTIPETLAGPDAETDENLFCYAAKAHPQFSTPGHLLVTYVCNLFARTPDEIPEVLRRLANSPELYRATAVSLELPESTFDGITRD